MSRKKPGFEINIPDEIEVGIVPKKALARRGPMASAIAENADALKARKSTADAIRAENDALAHEYVSLNAAGHVVQPIALDDVHMTLLVRDRLPGEDHELESLVTSIQDLGLSNPIRVLKRPDGSGYELVQGFRRLSAYRALLTQTGGDVWAKIPALIMPGEVDDIEGMYRRMVDENLIRKDLSFAEMAHAARNFADDPSTQARTLKEAIGALFQSAPYSKRSYIRSFAALNDALGPELMFATDIPRALGVSLAREIKEDPSKVGEIAAALAGAPDRDSEGEMEILRRFVDGGGAGQAAPDPASTVIPKTKGGARTKTTFHIQSSAGQVKCTAAHGRLEIKVDRDFSAIERARLEQAIASLIDGLG